MGGTEEILTMAKSDIRYVPAFRAGEEYERQTAEARRRQALAEALEAQAYQPLSGSAAPIPSAAPLVMALQSFMSARQRRKAEEAAEKAGELETQVGKQIAGRLRGGYVYDEKALPPAEIPEQTTLEEVRPTAQYRRDVEGAMDMAMSPVGTAAMKRAPMLAAALERSMTPAEAEEYYAPVLGADNKYVQFGKRGSSRVSNVIGPAESKIGKPSPSDFTPESIAKFSTSGNYADLVPIPRPAPVTNINMASEGERKDAYNLARVVNAASTINAATKTEPGAVKPGLKEAAVSALPGVDEASYLAQSPQRQIVTAAQTDMIDALLTLATGAAYTKEQLAGQRAAILPRFGESKESIIAKKQRVKDLATAARIRAGRAWTPEMDKAIETAFGSVEEEPITDLPPRPR